MVVDAEAPTSNYVPPSLVECGAIKGESYGSCMVVSKQKRVGRDKSSKQVGCLSPVLGNKFAILVDSNLDEDKEEGEIVFNSKPDSLEFTRDTKIYFVKVGTVKENAELVHVKNVKVGSNFKEINKASTSGTKVVHIHLCLA